MKRALALSVLSIAFLVPARATSADVSYAIFVDGRPIDASTPSGLLHRGVIFINVVRAVKTFDGLLTFAPGGVTRVSIGGQTVDFRTGSRTARSGSTTLRLPGAPFVENGDTYVPLATIASLASAKLSVDAKNHRYSIELPEPAPPTPTPLPTAAPVSGTSH